MVSDQLPAGVAYVSGTCQATNTPPWTWTIGDLAASTSATCEITVKALGTGQPANTASVDGNKPDPTPDDNTPTAQVTIVDQALPATGSSGLPDLIKIGATLTSLGWLLILATRRSQIRQPAASQDPLWQSWWRRLDLLKH